MARPRLQQAREHPEIVTARVLAALQSGTESKLPPADLLIAVRHLSHTNLRQATVIDGFKKALALRRL